MMRKYCKEALSFAAAMMSFLALADAEAAKEARRFATGGEVTSFRYTDSAGVGWTAFLHTFTNTAEAAEFRNTSGKTLPVRMLAVGGGGAGMDGTRNYTKDLRPGGGGGGGGGVTDMFASLSASDEWTIRVGVGGAVPSSHAYGEGRGEAGATSISNEIDNIEIVLVPGGGAGGGNATRPTSGAAGGGGSNKSSGTVAGAEGNYHSSITGAVSDVYFKGGDGSAVKATSYGGGGGGAGASGNASTGGVGLQSNITGEDVVYGSGGGGGGHIRTYPDANSLSHGSGGEGGTNAGNGGLCNYVIDGATTNVFLFAATAPVANTGSGGGGGVSFGSGGLIYTNDVECADRTATTVHYATAGADGVVIIRYDIPDTPCVGGDIVTVTTNGSRVIYIHKFTNTTVAATFKPSVAFDGTSVRLLVVGGGGAGMDGLRTTGDSVRPGGGGGGGGGVTETNALLSAGDEWTIHVGAGGAITNHTQGIARGEAGASCVSNGVAEVMSVPGGGAGGSRTSSGGVCSPTVGAAGGGGSSPSAPNNIGAIGEYSSSTFKSGGIPVGPFSGGTGGTGWNYGYGGGGGGAGASADEKNGGAGLISDITGLNVYYGSGGGGGGFLRLDNQNQTAPVAGGNGGDENAAKGGTGYWDETRTTLYLTAATEPAANTGGGGAGGASFNVGGNSYTYATSGADGVVIIRYEVKHPTGFMLIFH